MKRILFLGVTSLLVLASCKKTKIVEAARDEVEPSSYLINKPTDTLTRNFLNNYCYSGYTDDLIDQKITTNKGKQRVYLVSCPGDLKTPAQVSKYIDDKGYTPAGIGYLLKLVDQFVTPRGILISSINCPDMRMRDYTNTLQPLKELMFQKMDYGTGCFNGYTYETGNNWNYEVFYVCLKK